MSQELYLSGGQIVPVSQLEMERVSSGVTGLDEALGGGYVRGRSVLVAGGPGTGKSILSWHFLFDGISKGETGILLSLDQDEHMIRADMRQLGWDVDSAVNTEALTILCGTLRVIPRETGFEYLVAFNHPLFQEQPLTMGRLSQMVLKRAAETDAKRIVVDGIGPLLELAGNSFEIRQLIYGFIRDLSSRDATVLLTHELRTIPGAVNDEMPFFIADGVIRLDMLYTSGDYVRTMRIVKMRGVSHLMRPIMFKITSHGIAAFPETRLPE
ncbi:MAG: RAD55 family ATPase [Candidatus Thorarchaeota archaeon]